MVTLLVGKVINPGGYAINDFETIPTGVVTNLNVGVNASGGVTWGLTTSFPL